MLHPARVKPAVAREEKSGVLPGVFQQFVERQFGNGPRLGAWNPAQALWAGAAFRTRRILDQPTSGKATRLNALNPRTRASEASKLMHTLHLRTLYSHTLGRHRIHAKAEESLLIRRSVSELPDLQNQVLLCTYRHMQAHYVCLAMSP